MSPLSSLSNVHGIFGANAIYFLSLRLAAIVSSLNRFVPPHTKHNNKSNNNKNNSNSQWVNEWQLFNRSAPIPFSKPPFVVMSHLLAIRIAHLFYGSSLLASSPPVLVCHHHHHHELPPPLQRPASNSNKNARHLLFFNYFLFFY